MPKLVWDQIGEHIYETGVDHGVFYPRTGATPYSGGVVWNGLTSVSEAPSGAEATPVYADNIKYLSLQSLEEFGLTIEAYTFPDEFMECDGTVSPTEGMFIGQQPRKTFGFSYRTIVGNDVALNNYGYKLHLVYGCLAAPSEKAYTTTSDSPEAIAFSWEITTTPEPVEGYVPTSLVTIDSTKVDAGRLAALEAILYGGETDAARMPLPAEVITILSATEG